MAIWNLVNTQSRFLIFSNYGLNKVISVVILTFYHFTLGKYLSDFAIDDVKTKFFRIYNEIQLLY